MLNQDEHDAALIKAA